MTIHFISLTVHNIVSFIPQNIHTTNSFIALKVHHQNSFKKARLETTKVFTTWNTSFTVCLNHVQNSSLVIQSSLRNSFQAALTSTVNDSRNAFTSQKTSDVISLIQKKLVDHATHRAVIAASTIPTGHVNNQIAAVIAGSIVASHASAATNHVTTIAHFAILFVSSGFFCIRSAIF